MSLRDLIETVRDREKVLVVYARERADLVSELRDHFASQNLRIEYREGDPGDPEHAVLGEAGAYRTAVPLAALESLVDADGPTRDVGEEVPYQPLLEHLDGATFTSYDRRQMLQASREVEDRAWRRGEGRLAAGFQTVDNFADQRATYHRLARSDLDVHVYASDAVPPSSMPDDVTFHARDDSAVADTWFVAYDGGSDETQKSALLAEERADGEFYGVWTYEPALVDAAFDALDVPRRAPS